MCVKGKGQDHAKFSPVGEHTDMLVSLCLLWRISPVNFYVKCNVTTSIQSWSVRESTIVHIAKQPALT